MQFTVVGLYDAYDDALKAREDLVGPGFELHELEPLGDLFRLRVIAADGDRSALANQVMSSHRALEITERREKVDYLAYWRRAYERARR